MVTAYKTGSDMDWATMTSTEAALVVDAAMTTKMGNIND